MCRNFFAAIDDSLVVGGTAWPRYNRALVPINLYKMAMSPLDNGNKIEKSVASLIRAYFPIYEDFYRKYLIPLTGQPNDPNWRNDTYPYLEKIGISAFGILKSINFISIKKSQIKVSADPDQTFKNIFFHFGLAIDCVESLSRAIILVESELKMIDFDKKLQLPPIKLIKKFQDWATNSYSVKYNEMVKFGKPILYYPQHDHNFLSLIVESKQVKSRYSQITKSIKDYRNFFIHNPGVDVFIDLKTHELYAIKKEMVNESANWASLRGLYNNQKNLFVNPQEMVNQDLVSLLKELNSIWSSVCNHLEEIYSHIDFNRLFKGYNRKASKTNN